MKSVLFIIYPVRSHIIAVIQLAQIFSKKNYAVYFLGEFDDHIKELIRQKNFFSIEDSTIPFGLKYADSIFLYKKKGKSRLNFLSDLYSDEDYNKRKSFLEEAVDTLDPEIIFLDSFISSDYICLYDSLKSRGRKFFFINTIGHYKDYSFPPSNSSLFPGQKIAISLTWLYKIARLKVRTCYQYLFLFGRVASLRARKKIKELGIDESIVEDNYPFNIRFAKIPEIVLSHREWDFPDTKIDKFKIYIGFWPCIQRNELILQSELDSLENLLKSEKEIIYVSFGVANGSDVKKVFLFLKSTKQISTSLDTYNIVVANISKSLKDALGPLPKNLFLFDNLPQTTLLSKSKVFITHGGFNSIKESIFFSVPMVVFPINKNYDQPGNSTRVVFHKLGLRENFFSDPQEILKKINFTLTSQDIKSSLLKFKKLDDEIQLEKIVEEEILKEQYLVK